MTRVATTLLSLAVLLPAAAALALDEQAVERARTLASQVFETRQFAEVAAAGDEKMQQVFPTRGVAALHAQIVAQLGAFEEIVDATPRSIENMTSVTVDMRFERGTLKLRLVINERQELAGLWIDGLEQADDWAAPDYVDPDTFREVELEIAPGDQPLGATLALPRHDGPHPAIVLVHGSGAHDRDETLGPNKVFRDLAQGLASRGIAALRYEKRTKAYPKARPNEEITLEYETIDDAVAAVSALRARDDIDHERIFVLGHSLGGLAAPFIAQRDPKPAGIILMAGPARTIDQLVTDQLRYLRRAQQNQLSAEDRDEYARMLADIEQLTAGKLPENKILGVPAIYWQRLMAFNAADAAETLTCPILIIHGRRDYQVSMRDYAIWKERLEPRENVTLNLYRDLNHLMMPGTGPSLPAEYQRAGHVSEEVIRDIAIWIGKQRA